MGLRVLGPRPPTGPLTLLARALLRLNQGETIFESRPRWQLNPSDTNALEQVL